MLRRAEAMTRSVRDLLGSGLAGQARRGDTLGVWTFNEKLYSGLLPLQQWSPDGQKSISERVAGFLAAQKFDKRARFDKVVPALNRVVRGSPFITIILVCSGEEELHGTPFDQKIDEFFRVWHLQQQDAGTPFVIAFRAQGGKFVDCLMNPFPWPAELPSLPKELSIPLPAPRPIVKESPKPATSSVPPLILSGKKRETTPTVKSQDSTSTNPQSLVPATNPAMPPSTPATAADSGSKSVMLPAPGINTVPAPVPTAAPNLAQTSPNASPSTLSQASTPAAPKLPDTQSPEPLAPAPASVSPTPAPPTREQTSAAAHPSSPDRLLPADKPSSDTTPVQIATVNSASSRAYPAVLWGAGILLVSAAAGAVWFWRRRSRARDETSLITESIDRRKK